MSKAVKEFSGLSSPKDLMDAWYNLTNNKDINIVWEYKSPSQIKDGFNVLNITYMTKGNETGHYVACFCDQDDKTIIYHDPIGGIPTLQQMTAMHKCFKRIIVDMSGTQPFSSSSCGFYCLTFLYNLSINKYKPTRYIDMTDKFKFKNMTDNDRVAKEQDLIHA